MDGMGHGSYKVLKDGRLLEFSHWDDIPGDYDRLIKFSPAIPPGPHTDAQHEAIDQLPQRLRDQMMRVMNCACCNTNRRR